MKLNDACGDECKHKLKDTITLLILLFRGWDAILAFRPQPVVNLRALFLASLLEMNSDI